jgi:hypothetical protein
MSVLYLALGIYVAVVALVLYIRPSSMFHPENGSWKEFGIDVSRSNTVFPFWMFAIIWAFVSYAIATLLHVGFAHAAMNSSSSPMFYEQSVASPVSAMYSMAPSNNVNHVNTPSPFAHSNMNNVSSGNSYLPTSMHVNTPMPSFVPPVSNGSPPQLPGYYFVEPQSSGLPRYVYFGPDPPSINNLVARSS